jgi:hypothetical protein
MESGWEEKKIQALFSELKTADEQVAPRFATLWNRAHLAPRRIRAFNPAFLAATALLVFGLVSLAVWSRYSQRTQPAVAVVETPPPSIPKPTAAPTIATLKDAGEVSAPTAPEKVKRSRSIRLSPEERALNVANQKLTRDAKAITNWQSPTSSLLTSPSDEIFSSLPQLNKSASELKSFLPSRSN